MLATLQLKISPIESLADTSQDPGTAVAGDTGQGESGFANLLRSSVGATTPAAETGGESLPESGSELPGIAAEPQTGDVLGSRPIPYFDPGLWRPKIDPGLIKLSATTPAPSELAIQGQSPDLMLETPVIYPPASAEGAVNPEALIPSAQPGTAAMASPAAIEPAGGRGNGTEGPQSAALNSRLPLSPGQAGSQTPPVLAPAADARDLAVRIKPGGFVAPTASLGLRENGQPARPVTPAAAIPGTDATLQAEQRMPLGELARRFEPIPLQRAEGRIESGADAAQTRITIAQPTQNLQATINPSPSALSLAPAGDVSLAGLVQQGTDLINTPVRDSAWGQQLGERVVMMAGNQLKQVEIRLTPAELGPLRVQVSVDDGAAHVTFHAQHAVTREALEQALPRLREMLAENGLSLGQADVSDRGVGEGNREREPGGRFPGSPADDGQDSGMEITGGSAHRSGASNGLLDTFV